MTLSAAAHRHDGIPDLFLKPTEPPETVRVDIDTHDDQVKIQRRVFSAEQARTMTQSSGGNINEDCE